MSDTADALQWVADQHGPMLDRVTAWAGINSGSHNPAGLATMAGHVRDALAALGGDVSTEPLAPTTVVTAAGRLDTRPLGPAVVARRRPDAPVRVFLGIHCDTVYGPDHPFQAVERVDDRTLRGPGVADAKGGLVVLLTALAAFERSPGADRLGWEVVINPDEEIGSPGSAPLLAAAAGRNHLGLVFEPALADGSLVGERKGSGDFDAVVRGRAAHAGRDFGHGRSATVAAAELVTALDAINRTPHGPTVNVGRIDGGGPSNVVPDLAVVRFNVRVPAHDRPERVLADVRRVVEGVARRDGITVDLHGGFASPPRPMDVPTTRLYQQLADLGRTVGLALTWHASGGTSDANKLAAADLPVIDTLGPSGGNLHSDREFVRVDTLVPKAQLTTLLLLKLAGGEIAVPPPERF